LRMSSKGTEALKDRIWLIPDAELGINDGGKFVERAEEAIVDPKAAQKLPDALDGIEFWAVRRKEQQGKAGLLFEAPLAVQVGMVVFCVVGDDDDAASGPAGDASKLAQIVPAGLGVEVAFRLRGAKLPIADADGPEVADRLAGRRVKANRVLDLRGNPHCVVPVTTADQ